MRKVVFKIAIILILSQIVFSTIIIVGDTNPEEILILKEWKSIYSTYFPDLKTIEKTKPLAKNISSIVIFGSWCRDSKNNVPKIIKIFEQLNIKAKYIAVLRSGEQKLGVYKKFDVKRIPTIIFYKNGKELGRIVENPEKTLEKDIYKILKEAKNVK